MVMMMVMKEADSSTNKLHHHEILSKQHRGNSSRRRGGGGHYEHKFSSFLSFGYSGTICLGIFVWIYMILLLCASPLLYMQVPSISSGSTSLHLRKELHDLPSKLKEQFKNFRTNKHLIDGHLMNATEIEINRLRKIRQENVRKPVPIVDSNNNKNHPAGSQQRNGFVVLGMHRSGTSMLSGLLVTGLGYNVGAPLIGGAFDNEKGFFELLDVVLQNDVYMNEQNVWWSSNVLAYDYLLATKISNAGGANFQHGRKALQFLNSPENTPWLQKDPRMCITLKTWLPLLSTQPAVIWTYRHPIEVAQSLIKREASFTLDHALRLWIIYNMRGIQNSASLCRVYTSNEAVLNSPMEEVQRISDELATKCHVPSPPNVLTKEQVNKFVDTSLQHNTKKMHADEAILSVHHEDCIVYELKTNTKKTDLQYEVELKLYRIAMQIFCDMKHGTAYEQDYIWPSLD
jgi:hypothetical protein